LRGLKVKVFPATSASFYDEQRVFSGENQAVFYTSQARESQI